MEGRCVFARLRRINGGNNNSRYQDINRDMDVFFLKPKKNLLIYRLKMLIKSRERLH